ncbi:hypothetical protein OAT67_06245 [Bacteriovoracaceae bacterium]|nr:hypothetical protein [Bacteriovoracaceae bacterium]
MKKGIVAIIPVKGNSDRVPKKNIRKFHNTSLIELKISQLLEANCFNEIVVSSEDESILQIAKDMGVTAHQRDPKYSTSDVPMSDVYSYLASEVDYENVAWVNVTNPLAEAEVYQNAVKAFYDMPSDKDGLMSVFEIKEYVFYNEKPVNFEPYPWPRSQDLKGLCAPSFVINILKREDLERRGTLVGENPFFYYIDPVTSSDIDYIEDFEFCEMMYKKKHS